MIIVTIVASIFVYPIVHSISNGIIIKSSGQIISSNITAESGSAEDIQAAVDYISENWGAGNVFIPAGTFNFVETGETWQTVVVPCGINIIGAETQKDSNGQVIEWRTVLNMPFEAPQNSVWFKFEIDETVQENTFRFSEIKLVGYRFYNINSRNMYTGILVNSKYSNYPTAGLKDFRVDHCNFQDMGGSGISISFNDEYNRRKISGLIDHNRFVNSYGDPGFMNFEQRTLGYAIGLRRWASDVWEETSQVWGQYTDYTVVIEDNYFSRWRHATCTNDGIHQIVRYNTFEYSYGCGTVDGHGSYREVGGKRWYAVGTRCMEVYENRFLSYDPTWNTPWVVNIRGGSALVYNNYLDGSYPYLLDLNNDWGNYDELSYCAISDTYIWNNQLNGASIIHYNANSVLNRDYFLNAPTGYTPYTYPHPLTVN
ncbi:MAG: hypothetical protein NUK62_07905 [Tenericutes bacterium]|nr:hypothetical protein [Mycoplasmatota bacterium]